MAFQQDYVLRMIEMMGEMLRRLNRILDTRERARALDDVCREQCGLPLRSAFSLSEESLCALLPEQMLFSLSEITYLQAKIISDEAEKQGHYLRALRLLVLFSGDESVCRARQMRLKEIMARCGDMLEAADYLACARFFAAAGEYAACEDAVFLGAETEAGNDGAYRAQGRAILAGLLSLPDEGLLLGGLPRNEVYQAMNDLEKWEKA